MLRPQLKTFLSVCDAGSFSRAAAALYMTPSAVLQQIRTLESELGAELFVRSSRGVTLTPAGSYLERRGRSLAELDGEIRREIRSLASEESRICIGSSIMEKVRLLYDLWVLFSAEEEKSCGIHMLSIDAAHNIPPETELIESVNGGVDWMRAWEFLEICQVSFGFAFPRSHPLARKERITLEDLRTETVVSVNTGSCDAVTGMLDLLRRHRIHVRTPKVPESSLLMESAFRQDALMVPLCWHDILINMEVVPFEYEFSLPYGIFYRPDPQPAVRRFLDFIRKTYREGNASGIVPVLD